MKDFLSRLNDTIRSSRKAKILATIGLVATAILISGIVNIIISHQPVPKTITYLEFVELMKDGKVESVSYVKESEYMTIQLYNDVTKDMTLDELEKYTYPISDTRKCLYPGHNDFRKELLENNIRIIIEADQADKISMLALQISSVVLPLLMFVMIIGTFKKIMPGQSGNYTIIEDTNIGFKDIIGHEEVIESLKLITKLLKDPSIGKKIGSKVPKGLLLIGPPGTGKTMLAKAVAHEAGVTFIYQNSAKVVNNAFVGTGPARIEKLFETARNHAPCIIFIDEIDAIGHSRGSARGHSEDDKVMGSLLQEMNGFEDRDDIFIIAATNRVDSLDEALVRSGRFDRQVYVNPPSDWTERRDMFKYYLKGYSLADDVDIDALSKQTPHFTGADIDVVCNEAGLIAIRRDRTSVSMECLEEAIDQKIFKGSRKKKDKYMADIKQIAYHEAGHAVMSHLLSEPIARISIQPNTSGVGGAVFTEDKDSFLQTKEELRAQVIIAYAGRAAEELKFGQVTTGASNDITKATYIMTQYIEKYGFDEHIGLLDLSVLKDGQVIKNDSSFERLSEMSKEL